MSTITDHHLDIDRLVVQLHAAADITNRLAHNDREKLLNAAQHLTIALETPVQSLMTMAKWVCSGTIFHTQRTTSFRESMLIKVMTACWTWGSQGRSENQTL